MLVEWVNMSVLPTNCKVSKTGSILYVSSVCPQSSQRITGALWILADWLALGFLFQVCPLLPVVLPSACDYTEEALESSGLISPLSTGWVRLLTHRPLFSRPFWNSVFNSGLFYRDKCLEEGSRNSLVGGEESGGWELQNINLWPEMVLQNLLLGVPSTCGEKGHSVSTLYCLKTRVIYDNSCYNNEWLGHFFRWYEVCQ